MNSHRAKSSPRYMDHRPPWRLWCFDTFWPWPCLPWFTTHPVAKKQLYKHTTWRFQSIRSLVWVFFIRGTQNIQKKQHVCCFISFCFVDGLQVSPAGSHLRKGLHRSPGRMFASHAHGSGCLMKKPSRFVLEFLQVLHATENNMTIE